MPLTRISARSHSALCRLAEETGETSEEILDRALEAYERQRLLDAINDGYAALKEDAPAWNVEREERELWDATLSDGDGSE